MRVPRDLSKSSESAPISKRTLLHFRKEKQLSESDPLFFVHSEFLISRRFGLRIVNEINAPLVTTATQYWAALIYERAPLFVFVIISQEERIIEDTNFVIRKFQR